VHTLTFELEAVPPYSFELTVHKPAGWSWLIRNEVYKNGTIWSAIRLYSGKPVGLKLRSMGTVHEPRVRCEAFTRQELINEEKIELQERIGKKLSADEDIREFYSLAQRDPVLHEVVKDLYGMRDTPSADVFSGAILAVTLQMAPWKRSMQMMESLLETYGERIAFDSQVINLWPTPEKLAIVEVEELQKKCKLGYRAQNLQSIAQTLTIGFPTLEDLEQMSTEGAKKKLMELRGIGGYSAEIISPHRGFPLDVWSTQIFHRLLFAETPEDPRAAISKVRRRAEERWGEWSGYAFIYVLNDLNNLSRKLKLKLN